MTGKLLSQSYRLDPTITDPAFHWIPEDFGRVEENFQYERDSSDIENAEILASWIKNNLKKNYAVMNVDPHPVTALLIGGDSWYGTEIFYRNQTATMKISARVIK